MIEDAAEDDAIDDVTATDGRVIGRRAIQTRRRILDTTAALLREHGALDLKVTDVAREVGTSPATFYQYFADVEDAILALAIDLVETAPRLPEPPVDWPVLGVALPRLVLDRAVRQAGLAPLLVRAALRNTGA